jgi:uncharacterized membrane protein
MPCDRQLLRDVPLFALLDDDELDVLAARLELRSFAARQRIYKIGDPGATAFVVVAGSVRVSTIDEDHQDVIVDEVTAGQFFGFASMLDQTAHQTHAVALESTECLQVDREDIATLILQKPHSGLDMLTVLGQQLHASQQLVRGRAARNPNEMIEADATFGERIADAVAGFGGSWTFILTFLGTLVVYTAANIALRRSAWDPYPFILLNLFLSMLAALQAPVIMMSQNRQDTKDRLRGELDYDVNRRAAADIQALAGKMNRLSEKVDDLDDLIRGDR